MKKIFAATILLFFMCFGACEQPPDFGLEPQISFKSVEYRRGPTFDSIYVQLNFQDGDGNLGLNSSDTYPPFNEFDVDSSGNQVRNPNYYNFFVDFYRLEDSLYLPVPLPDPNLTYNGRFPRLSDDGKSGPMEGVMGYAISSAFFPFQSGDSLKLEITIQDRDLNKSNTLTTPAFVIP